MHRHLFDLLVELRTEDIRLDCAALHLARDVYPHIDVARYLRQLDALAEQVAERRPGLSATLRYQAMRDVLVVVHNLTGNREDYFDSQNSYLNRVLDRRVGVPVSLSTVWIEVGRRLKWPVAGIALPGHFLVRFDDPERFVLADPFGHGRSLSLDDCRRLLAKRRGRKAKFSPKLLKPVSTRSILSRTLRNLRSIYLANGNWRRLAKVLHRLAALQPGQGKHLQDLAAVHARLGDMRGAYRYLQVYLCCQPNANDHDLVCSNLKRLEAAIVALN